MDNYENDIEVKYLLQEKDELEKLVKLFNVFGDVALYERFNNQLKTVYIALGLMTDPKENSHLLAPDGIDGIYSEEEAERMIGACIT